MGGCLCMLLSSKGSVGNSQTVSKASVNCRKNWMAWCGVLDISQPKMCVCERIADVNVLQPLSIATAVCKLPAHNAREFLSHQMAFVCPI